MQFHMDRIKTASVILFILMVTLPSCIRDVIMDAKERPQVVVVCVLSDDPVQTLQLSFTKGASLAEAPALTEAVAMLYDGTKAVGEFKRGSDGIWRLEYAAIPGHTYRLEVQVPGYDLIYAEQMMPTEQAYVEVHYFCNLSGHVEPWSGWVTENDPAGDWTYRRWPEDEEHPAYETCYQSRSNSSLWICAMNYNEETGSHEIAEYICTDADAYKINLTDKVYEPLKKDVPNPYKFNGYYPDLEETFYSAHQMELYPNLAGMPLYRSYLCIPKGQHVFSISGSFKGFHYHRKPNYGSVVNGAVHTDTRSEQEEEMENNGYLLFTTLSADYEKYMMEAANYQQIMGSSDISTIYLRDNLFTNISGGVGIFGARISRRYPWTSTYAYVDAGVWQNLEQYIDYVRTLSF